MDPQRFEALKAQGYNRIPVVKEILADLDTPLSTYLKLADAPHTFLLESVEGGETWGRYSIIGLPAAALVSVTDGRCRVASAAGVEEIAAANPLDAIERFRGRFKAPDL